MKKYLLQVGAVVLIVAAAIWLWTAKPRRSGAPLPQPATQSPSSAFLQPDLLAEWSQRNVQRQFKEGQARRLRVQGSRNAQAFLLVSAWAAHPDPTRALGTAVAVAARETWDQTRDQSTAPARWLRLMQPPAWEGLDAVTIVGHGTSSAAPLTGLVALAGEKHLRNLINEEDDPLHGINALRITFSNKGTAHRLTCQDMFKGEPVEADDALRALRDHVQEKLRQLGGSTQDPTETLRENHLERFTFCYTLDSYQGLVEARLEPQGSNNYRLRVEAEEHLE
jgi:hypothetical protein